MCGWEAWRGKRRQRGGKVSGTWVFLIAALGAGVGGFLALMLYALCYASGSADLEREAYAQGRQDERAEAEARR